MAMAMAMTPPPPPPLPLLLVPLVLVLLLVAAMTMTMASSRRRRCLPDLPPSPPGLPIIGHLHLVGDLPHVTLRDLARKHAPDLMLLRLGAVPTLVVSSPRAAKLVLRAHDHIFASRPTSTVTDDLLYGSSDVAFSPYGDHWRQLRRLVTTHLLSARKVHSYALARRQEVRLVTARIRETAAASTAAVDMTEMMNTFANDMVCRAVSGKFSRAEGRNRLFRELIQMNVLLLEGFSLEDYFPGLARSLAMLTTCFGLLSSKSRAAMARKKWDDLLDKIIKDHETSSRNYRDSDSDSDSDSESDEGQQQQQQTQDDDEPGKEKDFVHVLLSLQQQYGITRDHVKAILLDMFGAGTDTSSVVLELAMTQLMRNPEVMKKLQAEVRKKTPEGQDMVEEENLGGMAYLRAVVKETMRLHPPAPLLLPRISMAECDVDGYTVPSGTRVVVNAWAIHRDPDSWEKPEEFMPERFMLLDLDGDVDFKGNDFQLLPFGAGRRICPGINFGMASVEMMLANLVYSFDWELPAGMNKDDIHLTEVSGLVVHPKEKLFLLPKLTTASATAM